MGVIFQPSFRFVPSLGMSSLISFDSKSICCSRPSEPCLYFCSAAYKLQYILNTNLIWTKNFHSHWGVLQYSMSQPNECHTYRCFDLDRIALQHTPSPPTLPEQLLLQRSFSTEEYYIDESGCQFSAAWRYRGDFLESKELSWSIIWRYYLV